MHRKITGKKNPAKWPGLMVLVLLISRNVSP
jgi:hypothetical protein